MTKTDFRKLFLQALHVAADNAEKRLGKPIPRSFVVELHAPRSAGGPIRLDDALDYLFIDTDHFYRIIDVAIKVVLPTQSIAFVRVSGHTPAEWGKTWDPSGTGPFKQILAKDLEDRSSAT